ncbi:MAG: hypothetical protein AB7S72_18210 [Draconibacterium sp.]
MWWNKIISWFREAGERKKCVNDFNDAARESFIKNIVPVYLRAEISMGNRMYKHSMSHMLFSGFRIKTLSGRTLSHDEVVAVGGAINANKELMRKLVTIGFDTLEICDTRGNKVRDWQITEIMQISNF